MAKHVVHETKARNASKRISASELASMPAAKRNKIIREQFQSGAALYEKEPGLIMDGHEDIIDY